MKRALSAFALILIVLAAASCPAAEEAWVSLFDGKTLDGWVVRSGTAVYTVEDGCIVGTTAEGSPNTFLCTLKDYGDFVLEFEVRNDPRLNSGVQVRSHFYEQETSKMIENKQGKLVKRTWPAGRVFGYQVEISNAASGTSGGIYDEAREGRWLFDVSKDPAAGKAFKDDVWNHYRVECRGRTIRTFVNGVPCTHFTEADDATGLIGLQVHAIKGPDKLQVRWRNLRIQELK